MAEVSGSVKTIGRLASLVCAIGLISFLSGLFFLPRVVMLGGIGLLVVSLFLFWLEESGQRRLEKSSSQ